MMHKYETIIYWSEEDEVFIAEVPELPGCMAHGSSPDEALSNIKEAIQLWIDTAKEFGDPIPEPKGRKLNICMKFLTSRSTGRAKQRRAGELGR
jgi:predicted RNase H-like HicB family nuclease